MNVKIMPGPSIYIAFHPGDELEFRSKQLSLQKTLKKIFDESQLEVFASSENDEIVYQIIRPMFVNDDEMNEFFEKLEMLQNVTNAYHPHFTQFQESDIV